MTITKHTYGKTDMFFVYNGTILLGSFSTKEEAKDLIAYLSNE